MADGKVMILTVLRCYTEVGKNVADVIPHYVKVVAVVFFMYMVYAALPCWSTLEVACLWLSI